MQPKNQQYDQTPTQPTATPIQPASSSQFTSGIQAQTPQNLSKQKTIALWASIASIAIFIIALMFGYVFPIAAILGAYGIAVGIRVKSTLVIVLGSIGLATNGLMYILSFIFPA